MAPFGENIPSAQPDPGEAQNTSAMQQNIELLQSRGELGAVFATLYEAAVEEEPGLGDIIVMPSGSAETPKLARTGGSSRDKDRSDSGKYEVMTNTDDGIEHYERLLELRKTSADISAELLSIPPEKMDAMTFASFNFLHELGHIVYFINKVPVNETHLEQRRREGQSLPFPGLTPGQLSAVMEQPEWQQMFSENAAQLQQEYGVSTADDLMRMQEVAYRALETEHAPDMFAVRMMKKLHLA